MKSIALKAFIAVMCLGLIAACGDDDTVRPEKTRFEGILEVDLQCNVIGGDTTDFLPRPTADNYSLIFACPNPTDQLTRVRFQISEVDSVWIFVFAEPGTPPVDTLVSRVLPAGVHEVRWTNLGPLGIYRVVMHTRSGFTSYGDVSFEEIPWSTIVRGHRLSIDDDG